MLQSYKRLLTKVEFTLTFWPQNKPNLKTQHDFEEHGQLG